MRACSGIMRLMAREPLLVWEGREYEHRPRSADWYWALGIIAVAGIIAAVLFGNYLLALLILAASVAVGLHAAKEPPLHTFGLHPHGIAIGEEFHPFDRMTSFAILEDVEDEIPPVLSIKTHNWFSPHLVIPLADTDIDLVHAHFLANVDEGEHRPTFVDLVAALLGF